MHARGVLSFSQIWTFFDGLVLYTIDKNLFTIEEFCLCMYHGWDFLTEQILHEKRLEACSRFLLPVFYVNFTVSLHNDVYPLRHFTSIPAGSRHNQLDIDSVFYRGVPLPILLEMVSCVFAICPELKLHHGILHASKNYRYGICKVYHGLLMLSTE